MIIKKLKSILFLSLLSVISIALIYMSMYRENYGNKQKHENKGKNLRVLSSELADQEAIHISFDAYGGRVKSVELNSKTQLMQITKDTYSPFQWAIYNPGYYSIFTSSGTQELPSTQDIDMDVPEAWMYMNQEVINRREVVVAIIDTGIDYTHPDLVEHLWVNPNEIPGDGIDNDMNGYVDDIYGWDFYNDDASVGHYKYDKNTKSNRSLPEDNDDHGTHIAGIIGAVADNEIGIAGIASNIDVRLMVLKINGGPEGTGSISDAVLAIKYATRMGADICNISWGTAQHSPALKEAIRESDMLFVAAAGNLGKNNDNKSVYPASYKLDNLISVTFIDVNGKLTNLSNYGKKSVEIAAPGTDIMSTIVGSYKTLSGSSMAAPQVSAVASLLYSYDKKLYPSAVKDIIIKTLKPIPKLRDSIVYPGIPNAYMAVQEMINAKEDLIPPSISLETVYSKENIVIPVTVTDEGESGIRVIKWLAGRRKLEEFNHGTTGLLLENSKINVLKSGLYTIYASDYSGNESIQIYEVKDDILPPKIYFNYSVSKDYKSRDISIRVLENQSGIRRAKYMPGKKKTSDFLPAGSGTELGLVDGKGSFKVKNDGVYTLYAIDNRGNQTVKIIEIKTVLSEEIKFTRKEKILTIGERYYLKAFVKPANTTDTITYTSSNERVATINSKGKVIGFKEGTTNITAKTNNGLKVVCKIVVVRRNS
jgi:hypothetical protein